ncbi:MAG: inositol monophosphatase family protein [Verrucomicrobiota bacterium]
MIPESPTETELEQLTQTAITAALEAAAYIADQADRTHKVERKSEAASLASEVFTEVDLRSEEIIINALKESLTKFGLGLLTEESEDDLSRFEKRAFWCIDPLDGSLPFIEGRPGFAVSIALVSKGGRSLLGVIADPSTGRLYQARSGNGATLLTNDSESVWQLDQTPPEPGRLNIFADRSFSSEEGYRRILERLELAAYEFGLHGIHVVAESGGALNAIRCIEKAPAVYFKRPKLTHGGGSLWDFAASACIVHEAGGVASAFDGSPLPLNRPDSTYMNKAGVLYASTPDLAEAVRDACKTTPDQ